jgi:hypothetical protein
MIAYSEISRIQEPWGVDVRVRLYDDTLQATIQEITLCFDSLDQVDQELPERMTQIISNTSTVEMPGFESEGCGKTCSSGCKYNLVQIGETTAVVDKVDGSRMGTLTVADVEKVLRKKGLITSTQKWWDFVNG